MYMIGCDVSKATVDAAWFDEDAGRWHDKNKIPNQRRGFAKRLNWIIGGAAFAAPLFFCAISYRTLACKRPPTMSG